MAKRPTNRQTTAKAPVAPAVTEPAAPAPAPAEPAPAEPVAPVPASDAVAPPAAVASAETIRMLVGQEGPDLSRMRGQVLTIGTDLDADEADRLVRADFAERI